MSKRISLVRQSGALRSYFPDSNITQWGEEELVWEGFLQPSPLSVRYNVKLVYTRKAGVEVFVVSPRLRLAPRALALPHVYNNEKQKLCLYYPANREWHLGMYFAKTILPWASEWLYYYELWLLTDGQWLGGGIEHSKLCENEAENNDLPTLNSNAENGTKEAF